MSITKLLFSVSLLCAFPFESNSQAKKSKVDSLKNLLITTKDDSTKGRIYRQLASRLNESKPFDAIAYADSATKIATRLNDTALTIESNVAKGIALFHLAEYASALECQTRALDLALIIGDEFQQASCYTNIGRIYTQQDNQGERAKEYYRKALVIRQKNHDKQLPSTYLNLSTIFSNEAQYDSARYYALKSIEAVTDTTDPRILSYGYNNMGTIYFDEKDYTNAIQWFERSKAIKDSLNDRKGLISSYANIGESYAMLGDFEKGIDNLNIALALANAMRNKFLLREVYYTLSDVYKMKGDYKNAYDMFQMYTVYRDSIFNDEKSSEILELQEKFESSQKQRENELLKNANDIQAESIRRKDLLNYSVVGCLVLALAGGVYFLYAYRQKQRANQEISRQKAQLEVRNKEVFDSITYAKRIQYTLLANDELLNKELPEHFVYFKPKDIVSGDFYWATSIEQDFYLASCDSTGHGVPGAFMSLLNTSFLNEAITEKGIRKPGEILDYVRDRLINSVSKEGAQDGMDGILLRFTQGKITYAAANNNPVIVRDGILHELKADKMPVGAGAGRSEPFTTHDLEFTKGDTIFIFTDGYADQFGGPKGKKFKYKQLYTLLESNVNLPLSKMHNVLSETHEAWRGTLEQVDDICIIGFRIQ